MIKQRALMLTTSIAMSMVMAMFIFMMTTKEVSYLEMQAQISTILEKMECKDNSCDRYKGKDAQRDFAAVHKRIDKLEKECGHNK